MGRVVQGARRHRVALAGAAAGLVCALAGGVRAEPTAAEVAVARKAFAAATELEAQKKWGEAEAKLREAIAIKETPGLRYHLGFCLENQQKLVEALVEYDRADEMLRQGVKAPDVSELLGPARDGVKKRVANVTLKLPAKVDGVRVEVDGVAVKAAVIGKVMPQNPGRRVFTASAPGRQPFRRELELAEGESRELAIDLPEKSAAPLAAPPGTPAPAADPAEEGGGAKEGSAGAHLDSQSAKPGSARTLVLVGELAFTAVALGAGVFFTIQKNDSQDEIDAANLELTKLSGSGSKVCNSPAPGDEKNYCDQLKELTDQRNRQQNLALAGFVGAGVGAAATLATFLLWKPAPKSQAALRVTPLATPHTLGLGAVGRF